MRATVANCARDVGSLPAVRSAGRGDTRHGIGIRSTSQRLRVGPTLAPQDGWPAGSFMTFAGGPGFGYGQAGAEDWPKVVCAIAHLEQPEIG